jgi:hypothetical protein
MGRQRAPNSETRQSPTEQEVAALVAAILAGSESAPNPPLAIAEALLNLLPAFLPSDVKVRISADVARLVSDGQLEQSGGSQAIVVAQRSNLAYRALYAVQAVRRLVEAVRGPSEESVTERLNKAFGEERRFLGQHLAQSKSRAEKGAVLQALANAYGNELSWNHRDIGLTHRPSHTRASGKNFDIREVPKSTGSLPGMEPGCHCFAGPPIPGARQIS